MYDLLFLLVSGLNNDPVYVFECQISIFKNEQFKSLSHFGIGAGRGCGGG